MRQGTAQAKQGRTAGHRGTMRLDNMHPQSGQQGQETSAGADKDSGGRSSDGTQASRCRQGKQIRPDSGNRQQIQPARKYPFLSVCGIFCPSQRGETESRKALHLLDLSALAPGLLTVCHWCRRRRAGYAIKNNGGECAPLPPCYASDRRRRKTKRA